MGDNYFMDFGGSDAHPVSNHTYSGFVASGYGYVNIEDWGGTADKLILPFASTEIYFEATNTDGDAARDTLIIMTSSTDIVEIQGQLEPAFQQKGNIEQIQFTDGTCNIGGDTPAQQTLSSAKTTDSPEGQVAALNEASNL